MFFLHVIKCDRVLYLRFQKSSWFSFEILNIFEMKCSALENLPLPKLRNIRHHAKSIKLCTVLWNKCKCKWEIAFLSDKHNI